MTNKELRELLARVEQSEHARIVFPTVYYKCLAGIVERIDDLTIALAKGIHE